MPKKRVPPGKLTDEIVENEFGSEIVDQGGGGGLKDGGDVGLVDVCVAVGCLVLANGFGYLLVIADDGAGAFG